MLQDLSPILSSWCKRIFFSLVKLPESLASSIYGFCHFIDLYIDSKKEQLYQDSVSTWRALPWLASNCPSWMSVECTVTCVLLLQRVLEQRVVAVLDKLLPKPSLTSPPPMEEGGYQQVLFTYAPLELQPTCNLCCFIIGGKSHSRRGFKSSPFQLLKLLWKCFLWSKLTTYFLQLSKGFWKIGLQLCCQTQIALVRDNAWVKSAAKLWSNNLCSICAHLLELMKKHRNWQRSFMGLDAETLMLKVSSHKSFEWRRIFYVS